MLDVAVCGEMASQPLMAFALIGLGVRQLSVAPRSVPLVKRIVRGDLRRRRRGSGERRRWLPRRPPKRKRTSSRLNGCSAANAVRRQVPSEALRRFGASFDDVAHSPLAPMYDRHLFTSESVTEGHPDKVADAISDAILDAILADDPDARVACETLVTTGLACVAGEITTTTYVPVPDIVRATIERIGYTDRVVRLRLARPAR